MLLDGRRHRSADADAVAAHEERLLLAVLIKEGRAERLAVLRAELEDLSRLDASRDLNGRTAMRARIARRHQADICGEDIREIAHGIHTRIMHVDLVCTRNGILYLHDRAVDDDLRALLDADGTHEARDAARCRNRRLIRHAQFKRSYGILQLHIVDFMVAAHESEHESIIFILEGDRLDRLFERHAQEIGNKLDGLAGRRLDLLQRLRLFFGCVDGKKLCLFHVRRIVARRAARNF